MSRPAPFGRTVTAMVTPFTPDGALDLDGAAALAAHLVAHGSDGLVVTGTTGESSTLTDEERVEVWSAVRRAVAVPVVAGSTSNDTAHSVELTRRAAAVGVDGILAVTPYYNRPAQAGIAAHFRAIAAASDLPTILYDIPVRTGRRLAPETLLSLYLEVDNIVGVKDATGDPVGTARLLAEAPEGFCCYCGDDSLLLAHLAYGAGGIISVATHWVGEEVAELIAAYLDGRVEDALGWYRAALSSFVFESSEVAPNPIPTKAILRSMGLPAGQCRLPLGAAPDGLDEAAGRLLAELEASRSKRGALG